MKISQFDFQTNWLARNDDYIRGLIRAQYSSYEFNNEDMLLSLPELLCKVAGFSRGDFPWAEYEGQNTEFLALVFFINKLPEDSIIRREVLALLQPAPERTPSDEDEELSDDAYEKGFEYFKTKRALAKKKSLRWYLEHQLAVLARLKNLAWWGKGAALMYGLAIGISMAGFMAMTIGFGIITQNWWMLAIPLGISWFSMQTNFWISRRAPSELMFDLFTSPREKPGSILKEGFARFLGLCNAFVYGGLTAYGTWEFFTVVGMTGSLTGLLLCGAATFALSMMVFLPELGLGIKFNRQQLDKSPRKRYQEMCASLTVDRDGKPVPATPGNKFLIGSQYVARFWGVFACVLVGAVFTALAAANVAASLMGVDLTVARILVSFIAMTVIPFYYDKALKNTINTHKMDCEALSASKKIAMPEDPYATWMRLGNALANAIPAFLGGVGLIGGPVGIAFGLFTGTAGFIASHLSAEDGRTRGYEDEINTELGETSTALQLCPANPGEPELTQNSRMLKATACPLLFRPFNTTSETRDTEMDLLAVRAPMRYPS